MKKNVLKATSLLIVLACLLSMTVMASAADESTISPQASYYIDSYSAGAKNVNGNLKISYDIAGTGRMTKIGATAIYIYDSYSNFITSYSYTTTPSLMGYNTYLHSGSITYYGTVPGTKYYALVLYRAENNSGYDTASNFSPYASF